MGNRNCRNPAVNIVLEDLHWADSSTLELAKLLADRCATVPLMLLCTARSDLAALWAMQPHHSRLVLDRLAEREVRQLVKGVAHQAQLSSETVETIVRRASGVPLFVEELTKDLLERGEHPMEQQIPATLLDSLTARLDRLGPARGVAQIGAAIGREFSFELVRTVANLNEREIQAALDRLVAADLVYAHRGAGETKYVFKHALVQDAAYNALLKSRRRELHRRIATTLEERFPEIVASEPALIAHHCTEGGLIPAAVRYWRRAAKKALERSANSEAISQLTKGLELAQTLPPTQERFSEEVRLQIALITPLTATRGYTVPEVERAINRARELCEHLGETPQLFTILGNLNSIYFNREEREIAHELAIRMLRLAERRQDPVWLLWAHYALGFTLQSQGKLREGRQHLEQSIALYDIKRAGAYGFVQDPGPTALALLSHIIHSLGYPDQALRRIEQALALARRLSHPFTLAWVLGTAGQLYWWRGDQAVAQALWQERATISAEQGFTSLLASATLWLGFSLAEQGSVEQGIAKMREATNISEKLLGLTLIAFALGKAGRADHGLTQIDEALVLAEKGKMSGYIADIYIMKGKLLLMKDARAFRKATEPLTPWRYSSGRAKCN